MVKLKNNIAWYMAGGQKTIEPITTITVAISRTQWDLPVCECYQMNAQRSGDCCFQQDLEMFLFIYFYSKEDTSEFHKGTEDA